jgi:LssY C-terminus
MIRTTLLILLIAAPLYAQTKELDIKPSDGWVDTQLDLTPGDTLDITATGDLQFAGAKQSNGPDGLPRGWADLVRNLQFNDGGRGALIGRVGSNEAARSFLIGAKITSQSPIAGHLFLAINQAAGDSATGFYHVTIKRTAAKPLAVNPNITVPAFTQAMIDSIPRRVSDAQGNLGDRVNFVFIGSAEEVQKALKSAGWVVVDKSDQDAVLNGLLTSLSKQAYVTMPMSVLDLWGRGQDFGYAQADPIQVVASRHHFRIWKAPFQLDGRDVWAGAGMHDIGFARDTRTKNGITHKIDPNSDSERDYIGENLTQTGLVLKSVYVTPTHPVTKASTATGSEYTSDGRALILYLTETKSNASTN